MAGSACSAAAVPSDQPSQRSQPPAWANWDGGSSGNNSFLADSGHADLACGAMYAAGSEVELFRAFSASCRVARPPGVLSPTAVVVAAQRLEYFRSASPACCCSLPLQLPLSSPSNGQAASAETGFEVSWRSKQHLPTAAAPSSSLVPRIATVLLRQLPLCSVSQAAKAIAALTGGAAAAAQLPENFANDFAAGMVMEDSAISDTDTETLSLLLCGFAAAGGRFVGSEKSALLLQHIIAELSQRLVDGPVPQPHALLADAQLPAVAWAVAISHATDQSLRWFDSPSLELLQRQPENAHPTEAIQLMVGVSKRARSHLMNRHSAKATFAPQECCTLSAAAALLGCSSPAVMSLMDAILGFVVRRLRAGHLAAVSRLDHCAQLLWALALLPHNTVVTTSCLEAVCSEITNKIVSSAASSEPPSGGAETGQGGTEGSDLYSESSAADLLTIAAAHWQLGFSPPAKLLVASSPFLAARTEFLSTGAQEAAQRMMRDFDFDFSRDIALLAEIP